MSTLNGSAAEPQTTVDVPEVGGDTDNWGTILNGTTLQALLNYILWLYARVPSEEVDTSGATEGDVLTLQSDVWVASAPSGGGAEALDDLSDVDTSGASEGDVLAVQSGVWIPDTLATVARTGDYDDLSNTPTLGTAAAAATGDFATAAQGGLADSAVQPGDDADTLGSGDATDGWVLTADGAGGAAWEAAGGGGGGADEFTDLTDTPANYTSAAGHYVRVNSTPDALEYHQLVDGFTSMVACDESTYAGLTPDENTIYFIEADAS